MEVPALNRKSPSTKFKIRGEELSVELLTHMGGQGDCKAGGPGDLILAYEAAGKMGEKYQAQLDSGFKDD